MRIAITPGEPAGIGPDLVIQLAQHSHPAQLVCLADKDLLLQRASELNLPLTIIEYQAGEAAHPHQAGVLCVQHIPLAEMVNCGIAHPANATSLLKALSTAITGCTTGEFSALVTGPLHKGVINQSGIPFTGHTEFLAEQTGTDKVVMMLTSSKAGNNLRVALATTHLPLKDVSKNITRESLQQVIDILHRELKLHFALDNPRILVCGLNPHAGEDGHLGTEEIDTISPVIDASRQQGMDIIGPLPADTLFTPRYLDQADAVLAMYHDQGLPVLKHVGFGQAVNVTLGLPIIRTSVDHGTAFELAGTGKAESGSLEAALQMAIDMANNQRNLL